VQENETQNSCFFSKLEKEVRVFEDGNFDYAGQTGYKQMGQRWRKNS